MKILKLLNMCYCSIHIFKVLFKPTADPSLIGPTRDPGEFGCDKDIHYTGPGEIQTPGYKPGGHYKGNTTCVWRIYGPDGYVIKLHFDDFGVEKARECTYDHVKLFDGPSAGDNLIATICGERLPHEEWSKTPNMMVVFYTDGAYNEVGLKARFEAVKPSSMYKNINVSNIYICTYISYIFLDAYNIYRFVLIWWVYGLMS